MGIERNDIWLHAAHALEGTRCATMQSGIGSANTSALQRGCQCVEPLFFWNSVRDGGVQAQSWFIKAAGAVTAPAATKGIRLV